MLLPERAGTGNDLGSYLRDAGFEIYNCRKIINRNIINNHMLNNHSIVKSELKSAPSNIL